MRLFTWLTLLLLLQASVLLSQTPLHLSIAKSYIGVTEKTGNNDGPEIEHIISKQGGRPHSSYCAYFVSFCLDSAKVKEPHVRSGMARSFKRKNSVPASDVLSGKVKIPPGTIIVWEKGQTMFGHTGFVLKWGKEKGTTVEGNTSSGTKGSQSNGDGIWSRTRSIQPLNYFRITAFTLVKY